MCNIIHEETGEVVRVHGHVQMGDAVAAHGQMLFFSLMQNHLLCWEISRPLQSGFSGIVRDPSSNSAS